MPNVLALSPCDLALIAKAATRLQAFDIRSQDENGTSIAVSIESVDIRFIRNHQDRDDCPVYRLRLNDDGILTLAVETVEVGS